MSISSASTAAVAPVTCRAASAEAPPRNTDKRTNTCTRGLRSTGSTCEGTLYGDRAGGRARLPCRSARIPGPSPSLLRFQPAQARATRPRPARCRAVCRAPGGKPQQFQPRRLRRAESGDEGGGHAARTAPQLDTPADRPLSVAGKRKPSRKMTVSLLRLSRWREVTKIANCGAAASRLADERCSLEQVLKVVQHQQQLLCRADSRPPAVRACAHPGAAAQGAEAMASTRSLASVSGASGTQQTPSANCSICCPAAAIARLVLPIPPALRIVTSRVAGSASSCASSASSSSLPTSAVVRAGRLWLVRRRASAGIRLLRGQWMRLLDAAVRSRGAKDVCPGRLRSSQCASSRAKRTNCS